MTIPLPVPEAIHPSLWRASQLARSRGRVVETGYPALSAELPGGGWPVGALVDLLVQQAGVGEMRLLRPALSSLGKRPVAMVQPPHVPNGLGLEYIGLSPEQLLQIRASKTADALWSAEQILRAGSCGALLFWSQYVQTSSLRRLHLAAQSSEILFVKQPDSASSARALPARAVAGKGFMTCSSFVVDATMWRTLMSLLQRWNRGNGARMAERVRIRRTTGFATSAGGFSFPPKGRMRVDPAELQD
jgi:hypothetical protein